MNSSNLCDSLNDVVDNLGFATFFNHLLNTNRFVDVTFVLETQDGEVEIFAHQLVLAMRSAYFADKFYGNQRKKENQIIRPGKIDPKAFEDMIRFCYGCKPNLETIEEIRNLFRLAYQFKVMNLTDLCRSCLRVIEIVPRNVLSMLEAAEYMEDKKLKNMCTKLIEEKTRDVMASYDLREITPTMVHAILGLPKLFLNSEYELTKWVFEWAKVKSLEKDSGCGNVREYLETFLQDINFLDLTSEEFAMLCKDYPNFFSSDEIAGLSLNIALSGSREMPDWYNKDNKFREYTERELLKKVNREIKEIRECIGNIFTVVVDGEEAFQYREKHADEIISWWEIKALSELFSVGCLYTRMGKYFEASGEIREKMLEILEKNYDEIGSVKEKAKEVVQEIAIGISALKDWKDYESKVLEKSRISHGGFVCRRYRTYKVLENKRSTVIYKIKKLYEYYINFVIKLQVIRLTSP